MTDADSLPDVERAAARYGIDLSGVNLDAVTDDVDVLAARYVDTVTDARPTRRVTVDPGDDPLNAFRNTFELRNDDATADLALDVAVKDNFGLAGVPMTCGSKPLVTAMSTRDATVVTRLLDAGATLVGKTNMDEFAYGATSETCAFGPVHNPVDESRVAGGSSSGSAAAVGAGLVDAALGSDTGGSVRMPAAFCGIVGFKPTWGTVSRAGMVDLAPSFDHVGTFGRDVSTTASVHAAIADDGTTDLSPTEELPQREVADASIGLLVEGFAGDVHQGVERVVTAAVERLESAGATVESVSVPSFLEAAVVWDVITNVELVASMAVGGLSVHRRGTHDPAWRADLAAALRAGAGFGEIVRRKAAIGALIAADSPEWYAAAQNDRAALEAEMVAALGDHDALCLPTMAAVAPPLGRGAYATKIPLARNTRPANMSGQPALSLPAGRADGLPVGLQLVGHHGEDDALLGLAAGVEAVVE